MPQLKLIFGPMSLSEDQSAKKDTVLALLYNGYRVDGSIYQLPALSQAHTLDSIGPVYVFYSTLFDKLLAVCGGKLFTVSRFGAAQEVAGCSLDADSAVTFAADRFFVYFAGNSNIHKFDGTSVTVLGGQSPTNVTSLVWMTGFLVANGQDPAGGGLPGDFGYSDTVGEDGIPTYATWAYENNESSPDALLALFGSFNNLFAFGPNSLDVSTLSPDENNPFYANKDAGLSFGAIAGKTVAYDGNDIYLLSSYGNNRQVVKLVGGREPTTIGMPVNVPIGNIADASNASGVLVGFEGETFYVLTFPTANIVIDDQLHTSLSLAFNLKTSEWYIWAEWAPQTGEWSQWGCGSFVYVEPWNQRFVGGLNQQVFELVNEARIDEPVMEFRHRDNGALEWSTPRQFLLGNVGDRRRPIIARGLGRYRERQDEISFSNGDVRTLIRTGWRSWGTLRTKISNKMMSDVKRGDAGRLVFNGIEEDYTGLKA